MLGPFGRPMNPGVQLDRPHQILFSLLHGVSYGNRAELGVRVCVHRYRQECCLSLKEYSAFMRHMCQTRGLIANGLGV